MHVFVFMCVCAGMWVLLSVFYFFVVVLSLRKVRFVIIAAWETINFFFIFLASFTVFGVFCLFLTFSFILGSGCQAR